MIIFPTNGYDELRKSQMRHQALVQCVQLRTSLYKPPVVTEFTQHSIILNLKRSQNESDNIIGTFLLLSKLMN